MSVDRRWCGEPAHAPFFPTWTSLWTTSKTAVRGWFSRLPTRDGREGKRLLSRPRHVWNQSWFSVVPGSLACVVDSHTRRGGAGYEMPSRSRNCICLLSSRRPIAVSIHQPMQLASSCGLSSLDFGRIHAFLPFFADHSSVPNRRCVWLSVGVCLSVGLFHSLISLDLLSVVPSAGSSCCGRHFRRCFLFW